VATNLFFAAVALPAAGQAAMLTYDIPNGAMANPTHLLSMLGMFRVNQSVWVGTLAAIGRVPLDKWSEKGVRTNVVRFEKEEWERVRALAERALEEDLDRLRAFMAMQMAKAEGEFASAAALHSTNDVKKARSRIVGLVREGNRRARAAKASMLAFDLFNTREDLTRAYTDACAVYESALLTAREQERVLSTMQVSLLPEEAAS